MHPYTRWYCFFVFLTLPFLVEASPDCVSWMAKVVSSQGAVDYQSFEDKEWRSVINGDTFCYGDKVRTGRNSRAALLLSNGSTVALDQKTTLIFLEPENKQSNWLLNLFKGSVFFRSRLPQKLNIRTPFINAVHEGTEFLVSVDSEKSKISVFDGIVAAENKTGRIQIHKGFSGIAAKNQSPKVKVLTIRPEDAVQWTLYYPTIIDAHEWSKADEEYLKPALEAYRQGDIQNALAYLDSMSVSKRNSEYLIFKASLFLLVGRVDEASAAIRGALEKQANNSSAFALQSIVAVTKNRQQRSLDLAEKAVEYDSQSATARLALSYAYQSAHRIEPALQAIQEAVRLAPGNALAWARLSELQLSTGHYDQAMESAQKARSLNPDLAKIQTVLGFAELAKIDIDGAKHSFNRAVELDASDPIARLGLGLVKIRQGDVVEGTRDLEVAVTLDPNNAVARSYLGKAYFELRNAGFAATEFTLAKEMDPNDPTPWFYDAILKQSQNLPVEALRDMNKAIELNDNRGVYRSRLLLDEDAAARTANLARVYNDLGFGRVALKQAWKSLSHDSSNHSAHRFLADAYIGQPRFRIARASELLQSQLLQPINITPVQPQLTAENIGILNSQGPSTLSANEYDPMFTSNGAHVLLNGAYGSNNTITDNAIVSGVYDNLSLSMGQFHFQTDGFRQNDDYQQDIYDAFAQYSFNQDLSIQFEFKSEDVRAGDVPFRLNGFHQENLRQTIEHDTARVGGHYRIDAEQDLIVSAYFSTRKEKSNNSTTAPLGIPGFTRTTSLEGESNASGWQTELQHNFHTEYHDIVSGFGYLYLNKNLYSESQLQIFNSFGFPVFSSTSPSSNFQETDYFNGYIYSIQKYFPFLTTTIGGSFDNYNDGALYLSRLNPKFGVRLTIMDGLILRGAALRSLKKPLVNGQTIEPTQVAGFNQFFDGNDGDIAWQYSTGLDYTLFGNFFLGGELNWRKVKTFTDNQSNTNQSSKRLQKKRDESSHLAYLYWTPNDWLALRAEYHYDKSNQDYQVNLVNNSSPQSVITEQLPLSVNFFHDNGFFSKFTGTYVNQEVAFVRSLQGLPINSDPLNRISEKFWTFDAALGYRLPKKLGVINFEIRNLFDNNFKYQSAFDASGPQLSPFVPEREFFVKLSLFY